jgi:hypothetical protein
VTNIASNSTRREYGFIKNRKILFAIARPFSKLHGFGPKLHTYEIGLVFCPTVLYIHLIIATPPLYLLKTK